MISILFLSFYCCFKGYPRTNNQCEGWHNKLARHIGTVHPSIFKLVEGLLIEQKETEHILSRIEAGHDPAPQRPKYDANDKRLIKIVQKFNEAIFDDSYIPYLKSIAHNASI